ncbi:MAG: protein translocase SEC61 complex subunit gamma [Candidatus Micrarchaeum sp. ARMAN-1]|jgi:protein translocase SEC61 complex gamma subunit|nr:MAG: protein translocase SEC61 complex subunit gamma [Candidatus Micrarchaeum sp. ARMAN-1]OJT94209.1 MAG: hypothetical protein JJ59_04565 [Candidatus Micrarchaeum sp. AZ1]OWP53398.1 MAG: protein translocase SEC61 complex subunit gamma [Thermoplasmatales archaeon ARMAN]
MVTQENIFALKIFKANAMALVQHVFNTAQLKINIQRAIYKRSYSIIGICMDMNVVKRLRSFWTNSRHIINISYRPKNDEFKKTAKVIIIGILIVGVLGLILGIIISLAIAGNLSLI